MENALEVVSNHTIISSNRNAGKENSISAPNVQLGQLEIIMHLNLVGQDLHDPHHRGPGTLHSVRLKNAFNPILRTVYKNKHLEGPIGVFSRKPDVHFNRTNVCASTFSPSLLAS